jgi:putative alpha-1,2-mannosidase
VPSSHAFPPEINEECAWFPSPQRKVLGTINKGLLSRMNQTDISGVGDKKDPQIQPHPDQYQLEAAAVAEKVRASKTINELSIMLVYATLLTSILAYTCVVAGKSTANDNTNRAEDGGAVDYTQHVNIWLGTQGGGNDDPAVARPFGMVKLGPDLYVAGTDAYSGYLPDGNFSGFSMMHEQGTGGAPKYGTVAQLPLVGSNISQPLSNLTIGRSGTDEGSVGYYKAVTSQDVTVELAASNRAGLFRYTFPSSGSSENNILVDVSHVLLSYRGLGTSQHYTGGDITIYEDGHYDGHGVYDNGWNLSPDWPIYFC